MLMMLYLFKLIKGWHAKHVYVSALLLQHDWQRNMTDSITEPTGPTGLLKDANKGCSSYQKTSLEGCY